jgi:hypothetical protein
MAVLGSEAIGSTEEEERGGEEEDFHSVNSERGRFTPCYTKVYN